MNVLLVIAEDRAIRESLRTALPETDLLLVEETLDDALRRLISLKADAVIVDDSPKLGKRALAGVLEFAPSMPVIVLSSRGDAETLATLTLAGARACVPKPFSCDAVCEAVRKVVSRPANGLERAATVEGAERDASALNRHQTALRWMNRISTQIEDTGRLSQSLVDGATDIFDAVRCAVLLEEEGFARVTASYGLSPSVTEPLRLSLSSGLMGWLEGHACLFDRERNRDAADAVKEMEVLGGRFAAPLFKQGRVCGALVVGDRILDADYGPLDRELLTVLGRGASVALEKAELYRSTADRHGVYRDLMANISAGVVEVMADKTVALMNEPGEEILGLRAADVVGRSVQKLGSGFADGVLRAIADGRPRLHHEVRDAATGATLDLSVKPLGNGGALVTFWALPEQRVKRDDVAYSPFWEYLASRVAQEVKNPMVAINTFAQLLPRKYDSEDFRDSFSRVVQKEITRINRVVETLFEFANEPELLLKRADLNETVHGVVKTFDEQLAEKAIEVELEWEEDVPDTDLDVEQFSQAVGSVVQNSIDAMPKGGSLKVSTRKSGDAYEVVIQNTGLDIDEGEAHTMFMPFFSSKETGMGLGLPLAARIMRGHNGELKLIKLPEGGSAFAFSLPRKRTMGQRENDEDDSSR